MSEPTKRIAIISPDGQFGTIDAKHAEAVTKAGGRVLSKQEVADRELQQEYAQKSTAEKVAGVAANLGPAGWIAGKAYTAATGKQLELPPELEAYKNATENSTVVLPYIGKAIADATGDHNAAARYVERRDKLAEASPIATGLGEAAGMVATTVMSGGLGAAGKLGTAAKIAAGPAGLINAAGNLAERGVARLAGAAAERGVLARAGVEAAKMGARGAVEGGLYAGAQSASEDLLHDRDVAVDKLFAATGTGALYGGAGGFLLGGASSLASSGLGAARQKVAGMLAPKVEQAAVAGAEGTAYRTAASMSDPAAAPSAMGKAQRVADSFAFDSLGATRAQADKILAGSPDLEQRVGNLVRRIAIDPAAGEAGGFAGAAKVAMQGRADEILPRIQAYKTGTVAKELSGLIDNTGARVDIGALRNRVEEIHQAMQKDPLRQAGADAFKSRIDGELGALFRSGKVTDGTMNAADAFFLRSGLEKNAYEVSKINGAAGDAYKGLMREFDGTILSAIDDAAARSGKSGVATEIRHWKAEWQAANAAEKLAEKGAQRYSRNNTFGIRESIGAAVGLALGSPIGAIGTMIGGKLLRERGSAVGAYVMSQMAERQALAKWVQRVDDQIGKASKGLLMPPVKGLPKASDRMPPAKQLATKALATVADYQRDPEAYVDKVTRQVESIAAHDPELADGLVQRHIQAQTFLASKVPVSPDPDPMDPHPAPKMTPNEMSEFGRYAWYTEKPARFFAEVARGKLTFEGAETAKALMPRAFAELQDRTLEEIAGQMAKGTKIPYRQRQYLGVLLDMAATPSQRPDHAAFLQANVSQDEPTPPPPKRSLMNAPKSHMSALDRLESSGVGRR
jgi:hypothetical protein